MFHSPLEQFESEVRLPYPTPEIYKKKTTVLVLSAQDLANEERMFALLDALPGLSVVSVGHRPSLIQYHDTKLTLASDGFKVEGTGSNRTRRRAAGVAAGVAASAAVSEQR